MRYMITSALSAAALAFVCPLIAGFSFTGTVLSLLGLALFTSASAVFMIAVGRALTLTMGIRTAGRATLVLLPIWLLGIWLLPAFELKLLSGIFPGTLAIESWSTALLAAAVLFGINVLTNPWKDTLKKPCDCG